MAQVVYDEQSGLGKASETYETDEVRVYSQVFVEHPAPVPTLELVVFDSSVL